MIIKHGDLFTTDVKCIGHGVNTQGVMGSGIAKTFREKYPQNYLNYKARCEGPVPRLRPGGIYVFPFNDDDKVIFNIASQCNTGRDAKYDWLFSACHMAAGRAMVHKHDRIAIPQIGCGIGGLEWDRVKVLLEAIEILVPGFQWEVWIYS